MRSLEDRALDFVGDELLLGKKSYGIVVDFHVIISSGSVERVLLVCDSGKRVDLASVLRYLAAHGKPVVYPDGSEYAKRIGQKKPYRYQVMFPANIPSNVRVGIHTVSIVSKEK